MTEDSLLASPPLTVTSQIVQATSVNLKQVRETVAEALLEGKEKDTQDKPVAGTVKPAPEDGGVGKQLVGEGKDPAGATADNSQAPPASGQVRGDLLDEVA